MYREMLLRIAGRPGYAREEWVLRFLIALRLR
jgi:hypothetical protein